MSLSSIARHVTGIVRGDAPGKGRSDGVRPDAENAGTSHADRMFRIRSVCAEMGLLTVATKAPDGRTYMQQVLDDERDGDIVAPGGAAIEEYALRPLVTRNLEKYLALGPQLAYKLNVPQVKIERRGNTVWVQVPAAGPLPDVATFAQAWALDPDIPAGFLLLGVTPGGHQLALNMDANHHAAIIAQTGSGKSWLAKTMALSAEMDTGAQVVLLDPAGDYTALSGHPSVWGRGSFRRRDDIEAALAHFAAQCHEDGEGGPRTYIICDEVPELIEANPRIGRHLETIARMGRHVGLHLVLCSQDAEGIVGPVMAAIPAKIVGRMANARTAAAAAGRRHTGAELIVQPGHFMVRGQAFTAPNPVEQLRGWAERYPPRRGVLPTTPSRATPTPPAAHQAPPPRATVAQSVAPVVAEVSPYRGDALPAAVRSAIVRHWMREHAPLPRRRMAALVGLSDIDNDKRERWLTESLGERWKE